MAHVKKLAPHKRLDTVVLDAGVSAATAAEQVAARRLRLRCAVRKPMRGTGVLSIELLIPKSKFQKAVRDIVKDMKANVKFHNLAALTLQQGVEYFLCEMFVDASLLACHCWIEEDY
ncbi:hypothetical protein Vadar_017546 [Vaccinium darrowii]|uniref:Uncharacterized protein n=1 Tax=Vaccinium darrowii TaxID=229202 RepID=A0ACB7X1G6_9ERIC|nr:hypothetical protein Vadar_017546 [Vaccinium darrowii]